ncbi:putative hydrolase [Coniochaeta sp. 2T2.1]|nr:putative hydrolase [Coniochaeta sp. 2T2.1]
MAFLRIFQQIDCHAHVHDAEDLFLMARHGVTTCLDMGTKDLTVFQSLRGGVGNCDIRSAGIPAMPPGSRHTSKPGIPRRLIVAGPEDAKGFVADRIADGADYIKVMLEAEGPDQATVDAVVAEAHAQQRLVIAHATTCETVEKAVEANVDVATHVPQDRPLSDESATKMKAAGTVVVPTLVKMLATAAKESKLDYANSKSSTISMRQAGITILAGTDANKHASGAGKVSYGDSMWEELRLLVEVGLSPFEALQSATSLPALFFGLGDRGVIELGKRADLILLSKDPLQDIGNINSIQRIWCGGVEVPRSG